MAFSAAFLAFLSKRIFFSSLIASGPNVNKNAKRFATLTYQDILVKQLHVMDATAAALCQENNIKTIVFDADVPENVYKVLENPSIGTIIEK